MPQESEAKEKPHGPLQRRMDKFISYYSYYVAGLMWGIFFRRFAVPALVLIVFWHYMLYGLIVGSERFADPQFHYWLPLTLILGILMGYMLAGLLNFRRLIFWKLFDLYGCWLPAVLVQFGIMHAVLVIWETSGTFVRPINFIVTFISFVILIPLWYFLTSGFTIWGYWDESIKKISFSDNAAVKFYSFWALYQLSATLIFTVFEWSLPNVWPFWLVIATFVFHLVLWFLISLFVINGSTSGADFQYKKIRGETIKHLTTNIPATKSFFNWLPWNPTLDGGSYSPVDPDPGLEMERFPTKPGGKKKKPTSSPPLNPHQDV